MSTVGADTLATQAPSVAAAKTEVLAGILGHNSAKRALVVGCGDGAEAAILSRRVASKVVGIDLHLGGLDAHSALPAVFAQMDAQRLGFPSQSFDLVYSFHALEHIPDPNLALSEMSRVLQPGGRFLVGTPNKERLVGYIGSPVSLADRWRMNVGDWRDRLAGRWENELGAHAGFAADSLAAMCHGAFGSAQDVSALYYSSLYPQLLVRRLSASKIAPYLLPCVYVTGHKGFAS